MLNMTMDNVLIALVIRSMTDYVFPIVVMRYEMFDIANLIVKQMARQLFSTPFANPSVESFAHSFLFLSRIGCGKHVVD